MAGGWWTLVSIMKEGEELDKLEASKTPVVCPNDYTTLLQAGAGKLHCPWDGWVWPDDA